MNIDQMFCPCCGILHLEGKEILNKTLILELRWEAHWYNQKKTTPRLEISSGYRCPKHNATVGGSEHSQHLLSRAMDIRKKDRTALTDQEAETLVRLAEEEGFNGIEICTHHIHVDTRAGAPYRENRRG